MHHRPLIAPEVDWLPALIKTHGCFLSRQQPWVAVPPPIPISAAYSFSFYLYGYARAGAQQIKQARQLAQRLQPFHIVGIRLGSVILDLAPIPRRCS